MDAKVNGETEEPDETTHRVLFNFFPHKQQKIH